ncbi:MAG: [Fe-Fe] hydrogenase large subunit C-terminal domain-containing protein [Kiritimatiellia bacterium]
MDSFAPVYSINAQCRDCYKCVRRCPVKAIRVENDHAVVSPDDCIYCGTCVSTCPNHAKMVRDDLQSVRTLVTARKDVVVSVAPSFASEFPGIDPARFSTALKKLGFAVVRETAVGANIVSRRVAELMARNATHRLQISSACPVVVELVQRYYPRFTAYLTPVDSPIIAHCKALRQEFPNAPIVFVGPCVGKKHESDLQPGVLNAALTFEELRRWLMMAGLEDLSALTADPDYHLPGDGAYYPIEGGMLRSVLRNFKQLAPKEELQPMVLTGIRTLQTMLETLDPKTLEQPVFIEALACPGGCVCGPKTRVRCAAGGMLDVLRHAKQTLPDDPETKPSIDCHYRPVPTTRKVFCEDDVQATLHSLGKFRKEDELNCAGCGYDSCRELACAILAGHAEPQMCVSRMRQIALKQSSAIDKALPYGLVVADRQLRVIECNKRFAELLGDTVRFAYDAKPGLRDADLGRLIPYPQLFRKVLETGEEMVRRTIEIEQRLFSLTVFNVDDHETVGALILDVTETEQKRKALIEKARTVVTNTSKTVQEIAFMLGRNAAESELILDSAVQMFAPMDQEGEE